MSIQNHEIAHKIKKIIDFYRTSDKFDEEPLRVVLSELMSKSLVDYILWKIRTKNDITIDDLMVLPKSDFGLKAQFYVIGIILVIVGLGGQLLSVFLN